MTDLIVCSGCCWIKEWTPVADRWFKWWYFMELAKQLFPSAAGLLSALSGDNGSISERPVCTWGNWGANRAQGWAEKERHCIAKRLRRCFPARSTSDCPGQPNTSDWACPCSLQGERAVLRDQRCFEAWRLICCIMCCLKLAEDFCWSIFLFTNFSMPKKKTCFTANSLKCLLGRVSNLQNERCKQLIGPCS